MYAALLTPLFLWGYAKVFDGLARWCERIKPDWLREVAFGRLPTALRLYRESRRGNPEAQERRLLERK